MIPVPSRAPSLVSVLLSLSVTLPVLAQDGAAVTPAPAQANTRITPTVPAQSSRPTWKVRRTIEIASQYNDNVFLLPDSRKADLDPPSLASTASGRYVGMQSPGDVITNLRMQLAVRGPGIGGRTLSIRPEAGMAYYAQNAERRSMALSLALEQELPHRSRLRVTGRTTPGYFARNYLVDAVDANSDGTIAAGERLYRKGTYRETSLDLDYRWRLDKSSKKSPFGADLELSGGWYARAYDAPFRGRDLNGPVMSAGLLLTVSRSFALDLRYRVEALSATPSQQVMVLDENDAGQDLNGNGSATDHNVRTVSTMDRSRTEHVVGVKGAFAIGKRSDLRVELDRRWRAFSSEQRLDVVNFGRRDSRNTISVEFTHAVARDMRLSARGDLASQRLRRGGDAGLGEIDDYTRHRVSLGVRYEF